MVTLTLTGKSSYADISILAKKICKKKGTTLQKLAIHIHSKLFEYSVIEIVLALKGASSIQVRAAVYREIQLIHAKLLIKSPTPRFDISSIKLSTILGKRKRSSQYLSGGVVPQ